MSAKKFIFSLLILFSVIALAQETGSVQKYVLRINDADPYTINITASFSHNPDSLFIHPSCPNYDYPDGWSTFINPVSENLSKVGSSAWIVESGNQVSYDVDISFIKDEWDVGNEQSGTRIDSSIFIVTRSLFLFANIDGPFSVDFELPENYTISTPWDSTGINSFIVKTKDALINNTLVWGPHKPEIIQEGNFNLKFVLLGYDAKVHLLINKTFKDVLSEYLAIFPNTPKTNYLITIFPYKQNDGEAYTSSNAFTLKSTPTPDNKMIWANQFAHELFHYWNGRMINGPNRAKRQWFSEGFTEYYANLAMVKSGAISEEEFYRVIEKTIGLYYYFRNRQFREISLVEAGSKKSKYRFGVYNGGWCAAFVMDMMIREKLSGKSLDDFMRQLYAHYGLTGQQYEFEDLQREFNTLIKTDQSFFEKYIIGTDELPIEYYFNRMGITLDYTSYEATAFLINSNKADVNKSKRKMSWLNVKK